MTAHYQPSLPAEVVLNTADLRDFSVNMHWGLVQALARLRTLVLTLPRSLELVIRVTYGNQQTGQVTLQRNGKPDRIRGVFDYTITEGQVRWTITEGRRRPLALRLNAIVMLEYAGQLLYQHPLFHCPGPKPLTSALPRSDAPSALRNWRNISITE